MRETNHSQTDKYLSHSERYVGKMFDLLTFLNNYYHPWAFGTIKFLAATTSDRNLIMKLRNVIKTSTIGK